ncbi:MAG: DUF885 domain-containing protein [Gammaproteobacteria bacterium]
MRSVIIILTSLLLSVGGTVAADDLELFKSLYDAEWQFRIQEYPEFATSIGINDHNDRLTHVRPEDLTRRADYYRALLIRLDGIHSRDWPLQERANFIIYRRQVLREVNDYDSAAHLIPLNSDWGFHMQLARLPAEVPLQTVKDHENLLTRMRELPVVMDEYIALMREGLRRGFTQPRVVLSGREDTILAHVVGDPKNSVFFRPFAALASDNHFRKKDVKRLNREAEEVIRYQVVPAFAKFLAFFRNEYLPGARETLAAESLPGGKTFYQQQIAHYTTLQMSAGEIHEIGLAEVARIRMEMEEIIKEVGFKGSFYEFLHFLRTDEQFFAKTPRELLMRAAYIAKKMDLKLPSLFKTLPRQPYGVVPVPDDLAPTFTTGRYVGAPSDSSRAGEYWVNTYDLSSRTLYTLPALTLHEAVPGHHLQGALAAEQGEQPNFRRYDYISAFGEGWGLYSEFLGIEAGIYATAYEHFGRLTYEMWRACRLVVDTGVHAMGWSREQAIDYLAGHTALSLHEVNTEIDRYISWPAQALSYKLGELTIKRLRHEASSTLGEDFDLREFHDVILRQGSVPLSILEEVVAEYISYATAQ